LTNQKADLYKQFKVASLLCLVPLILGAGPFSGFYLGQYVQKKFNLPSWVTSVLVVVGILAAAREAWRIIKIALRVGG